MIREWSHYQQDIFRAVAETFESYIVEAVAGSGKTTVIVESLCRLLAAQPHMKVLLVSFNKPIEVEMNRRLTMRGLPKLAKTLHSCGLRTWNGMIGEAAQHLKVENDKVFTIMKDLLSWEQRRKYGDLRRLVGLAKQHGLVPGNRVKLEGLFAASGGLQNDSGVPEYHEGARNALNGLIEGKKGHCGSGIDLLSLPEVQEGAVVQGLIEDTDGTWKGLMELYNIDEDDVDIGLARAVLRESLWRGREVVDFDDMLYLPVVTRARFDTYDVVFCDECQDLNGIQIEMVERMVRR